jgi:hypothetical protein
MDGKRVIEDRRRVSPGILVVRIEVAGGGDKDGNDGGIVGDASGGDVAGSGDMDAGELEWTVRSEEIQAFALSTGGPRS